MKIVARTQATFLALCLLMCASLAFSASMPYGMSTSKSSEKKEEKVNLEGKSPAQVDEILATMSDEQVRSLLITTLRHEAAAQDKEHKKETLADFIHNIRERMAFLRERITFVFSGAAQAPSFLPKALRGYKPGEDKAPLWRVLYGLGTLLLIWFGGHWLLRRMTRALRRRIEDTSSGTSWFFKLSRLVFQAFLELLFIAVVVLASLAIFFILFNQTHTGRALMIVTILSLLFYDLLLVGVRFMLAPKTPALRLFPLEDAGARHLYWITSLVAAEIALGLFISGVLQIHGSSEALYLLVLSCTGLVVVLTLSFVSLWTRKSLAARLRSTLPQGTLRYQLANSWYLLLIGYLVFFWLFWVAHMVAFGAMAMLPGLLTLLALPIYMLLTLGVDRLVALSGNVAKGSLLSKDKEPSDPATDFVLDEDGKPMSRDCPVAKFRRFVHKAMSLVLFAVFIVTLAHIWGIRLPLASRVAQGAFSAIITLILGYVFWAFCKAAIERKLSSQAGAEEADEHGAGAGDRLHTLLELLKRFIFVALVILVTLIVLSSLGVDTGPLLAGASVFGIAIGFGSQTLVKDIVSGVFFLMDDAFRIGDYIELGNARGTVEGISVRSLKLRHHRGALYTVPYGSIHMVMNLSRDWAIMKLEYVVPHDTDIQQVKKIVKRINKELKEIPELASVMLGDVKSQGVKEIEEYGMRMRIKMTTTPGGQFTLRKWIWGKLRRYFEEAGIEFAHRKVSVMLPEGEKVDKETLEAAGAAAAKALEEENQQAQGKV